MFFVSFFFYLALQFDLGQLKKISLPENICHLAKKNLTYHNGSSFFQANNLTVIKLINLLVDLSAPEKKELQEAENNLKVIGNVLTK